MYDLTPELAPHDNCNYSQTHEAIAAFRKGKRFTQEDYTHWPNKLVRITDFRSGATVRLLYRYRDAVIRYKITREDLEKLQ